MNKKKLRNTPLQNQFIYGYVQNLKYSKHVFCMTYPVNVLRRLNAGGL